MSGLLLRELANGIAFLTLADPERRNVLSEALCDGLIEAVSSANADPKVHAIVIQAQGKAFCAGAHLGDLKRASLGDTVAVEKVYQSFLAVANSPLPTVCVINGAAVGAGMNLALACDIRVGGPAARFDTRFLDIGLHPGGGHTWMLLRAVGWQRAAELVLLSRSLGAEEAEHIGLLSRLASDGALSDYVEDMAAVLGRTSRDLLLRTKASLRHAATASHSQSFEHETQQQMWSLQQEAFQVLLRPNAA